MMMGELEVRVIYRVGMGWILFTLENEVCLDLEIGAVAGVQ